MGVHMIVNKVDKGGNVILKKGKAYCQFCEEFSMVMINYGFHRVCQNGHYLIYNNKLECSIPISKPPLLGTSYYVVHEGNDVSKFEVLPNENRILNR